MGLSEHYFGDVEAIDEGRNYPSYFDLTYVLPESFSVGALNNKKKYIIVGRKGSGKTAMQFHLSKQLAKNGYLSHFFSFHNDLKPSDYNSAAQTQKIDVLKLENSRNIFLNYDFREVWGRTILLKIAETLVESGFESSFTKFCLSERSKLSNLFDGILRSANLKVSAEMAGISAELGLDLSKLEKNEISLSQFNEVARNLLLKHHDLHRLYVFVDELVFSKLDARDDEVRVRAAMVRDIFRSTRTLNNFFVQKDLDFHIICAVRPEIRDLINDLDSEIGKLFDGKSVELAWDISDGNDSLLFRLLKQKVIHSKEGRVLDFDKIFPEELTFNNRPVSIEEFIKTNTWARPRDIVQFLNSIADKSPNADIIGEDQIKRSLNEYGRRSFSEIVEEISVKHGALIASKLRASVNRRDYRDFDSFSHLVLSNFADFDRDSLLVDLFNFGVIGNYDDSFRSRRYLRCP